jgi:hypothetical protein
MIRLNSYLIVVLLVFGVSELAHAKNQLGDTAASSMIPAYVVKLSPLALLELPHPSLQVAVEYRIAPHTSLQHELGWLPPFPGSGLFDNGSHSFGFKAKSEARYYFEEIAHTYNRKQLQYLAFEVLYRSRIIRQESWYRFNGGSFSQWLEADQYRNQMAFHFKYGRQIAFPRNDFIFMDYYAGLGLRRYFARQQIVTQELHGTPDNLRDSYNFILPSLTLGLKIGFGR